MSVLPKNTCGPPDDQRRKLYLTNTRSRLNKLEAKFLNRLGNRPVRPDLTPIRREIQNYYIPSNTRVIQVVGSNGKGSFIHYLNKIFVKYNQDVVSYTSPHFQHPRERFKINDEALDHKTFLEILGRVYDAKERDLTPFEVLVLMTLKLCGDKETTPEFIILEAGMGGRWDATSVIQADTTVLTSVDKEHTEYLGDTIKQITREKTAQIPHGSQLVAKKISSDVSDIIQHRVEEKNLSLETVVPGDDVQKTAKKLASTVASLYLSDHSVDEIISKIEACSPPPGRRENLKVRDHDVILDVAHTPKSIGKLLGWIDQASGDQTLHVIFGCLEGKETSQMLSNIEESHSVASLTLVEAPSDRALSPKKIKSLTSSSKETRTFESLKQGATKIIQDCSPNDQVLVTGSFNLVGWFRDHWT